MRVDHIDPQNT